jgi:thioredoxin 1
MSWVAGLALVLAALGVAVMLWTGLSAGALRGQPVDALQAVLPGLEAHRRRAVVYCHSPQCGPCRTLSPEMDRLRAAHPNVFKLDVMAHPREARALGIRAVPTTLLVEDGRVLKALLGAGAVPAVEVFLSRS